MNRAARLTLLGLVIVLQSGCVQEVTNRSIGLGDVTLGQQLIDLQTALESEAINETEFDQIKDNLIASAALCSEDEGAKEAREEEEESFWF